MSILLLAHRKKAIQTKKKIFRKVGERDHTGEAKMTNEWERSINGVPTKIGFSRDNRCAYINGYPVECTAYITDEGFDLDLKFMIQDQDVHIFSDVEKNKMTNYLFVNGAVHGVEKKKLK